MSLRAYPPSRPRVPFLVFPSVPRPPWWNDAELLRLSEEVLELGDQETPLEYAMRAHVLSGEYDRGERKVRSSAQYRESARCFRRAAEMNEGRGDSTAAELERRNVAQAVERAREKLTEEIAQLRLSADAGE